jgi:molecular chaperone GrpE
MIKKKSSEQKHTKEEPNSAQLPENDANPTSPAEGLVEGNAETINELRTKVDELNDKYLRLYSEFDNYRKRTLKEKIDMSRTASEEVIVSLLTVLDDIERAQKSFETTDKIDVLKEGVQHVYAKFRNILGSKGLKEMNALGETFDTDFHEAITHIPAPSDEMKNKVLDEVEKGYMLNDKVIRYAKVVIGS